MANMLRTRSADQGDGTYINPIFFGQYSDICILRDGEDYYLNHGFRFTMFHSKDLVNWEPLYDMKPHLDKYGLFSHTSEMVKFGDTYYYYGGCLANPDSTGDGVISWAMSTKDIHKGEWSEPHILGKLDVTPMGELISSGVVQDLDGKRYMYCASNYVYPLTDDGFSFAGPCFRVEGADDPIPDEIDVEGLYIEEESIFFKDGYYYLQTAQGGTVGPATSHGSYIFRAPTALGPWESCPYNPILKTYSKQEKWWSRGRGRIIDTPDGEWYIVYHAILNGWRGQGRMTLMEPIEWVDGWPRVPEGMRPEDKLPMPKNGKKVEHGFPLYVDFSEKKLNMGWDYLSLKSEERVKERLSFVDGGLKMKGSGTSLHDTDVIMYDVGFKAYEVTTELEISGEAGGGLSLYFGPSHCVGISLKPGIINVYDSLRPLLQKPYNTRPWEGTHIHLKLIYKDQIVSPWYSADGVNWTKLNICFDVEPFCSHASLPGSYWMSWLRPTLFAFGEGDVVFKNIEITPLDTTI